MAITLKDIMTPGFSTGDPFAIREKERAAEREKKERAAAAKSSAAFFARQDAEEKAKLQALADLANKRNQERKEEQEMDDSEIKELELKEVAEAITGVFEANQGKFMLLEPLQLTVRKPDGSFSKRAHIGSEEFKPTRCYAGKRGTLIMCMAPLAASDYLEIEVSEEVGNKSFSGFKDYMTANVPTELREARSDALKAAALKSEQKKLEGKVETYADLGFGSW